MHTELCRNEVNYGYNYIKFYHDNEPNRFRFQISVKRTGQRYHTFHRNDCRGLRLPLPAGTGRFPRGTIRPDILPALYYEHDPIVWSQCRLSCHPHRGTYHSTIKKA